MRNRILFIFCFVFLSLTSWVCAEEKWQEYQTFHFVIYYKDAPQDFIKSVEETAERYYTEIMNNLGFVRDANWFWDNRGKIYIYADQEEYIKSSKQPQWSSGHAVLREKIIRTYPLMNGFFDTTLPHELGHIIFREFVGFQADIPIWLDEGVAMYQEKAKRWGVNRIVKKAIDEKSFIPLKDLSFRRLSNESDRQQVELFYAESASVVYYLMTEFGKYKFVELCRHLKDHYRLDNAIEATYQQLKNKEGLNKAWMEYIQR